MLQRINGAGHSGDAPKSANKKGDPATAVAFIFL